MLPISNDWHVVTDILASTTTIVIANSESVGNHMFHY